MKSEINSISNQLRFKIIEISKIGKAAHVASALSCIDIILFLYEKIISKSKKNNQFYHKFILSKGHAAVAQYVTLNYYGIISDKLLSSFNKKGSILEEHPSYKVPGVETSTGSLGHGLPVICGMALASKLKKENRKFFIILGDGECNEGTIWEAALFASAKKLNNLYIYIDFNTWQATGRNKDIIDLGSLEKKFESFGFHALTIDGHNFNQMSQSYHSASKINKPKVFICKTIKGKGISYMEDDNNWHYKVPNEDDIIRVKKELAIS